MLLALLNRDRIRTMTLPIQSLINPEQLDAVMKPITEARGMPNASYTSEEAFQFERDYLFAPHWAAIAFEDSLDKGEAHPVDFMGIPLLLTRDRSGAVRVFHNVCSHRGMQLVDSPRKTNGLLVCPYHSDRRPCNKSESAHRWVTVTMSSTWVGAITPGGTCR